MNGNTDRTPLLSSNINENPYKHIDNAHEGINDNINDSTIRQEGKIDKKSRSNASSKIGLQRTSRTSQKMKLLPEEPLLKDASSKRSVTSESNKIYTQVERITDVPARKDAETLGKVHRDLLPRVTAYCTSGSYRMKDLMRWLKDRKRIHNTNVKLFDDVLYTPFTYKDWRSETDDQDKTIRLADEGGEIDFGKRNEIFIFEYGVVVMWGYSIREEQSFLIDISNFENEKLSNEDIQVEEFNYYITKSYQPRIYNDFITISDDSNYMLKLSISHAISQSVKISLFEELVNNTIEDTQDIPQQIATTGKVEMNRNEIMKSIGELFILRININLHGSVLDSPELMWVEPQLEPIYQAVRGYLEINERVELLNQRLEVISDLLQMLKEQLGQTHEKNLEYIVIILVGIEVLVSAINIIVDLFTY
ncbi:sporulation protein rmd1 [Yamadazyma tenuis]|uniref:DUF155 domain-containing protein n=1 Tax=Candida tenuis (strain ATCC 10573 / BCRC 21748 / CBS 615 / JCM 9827 / NBRC 10315 / NRRL Y-1498 / VKM Y-70) TaxID=590646 RepID=G3B9Q5_CANTC|nr:uncharacterized protein CANTEDRAFT_109620 [Yamadazyma tenuis ATCC 10573]EGV61946.1 hypothetical protein CANTEDRAFT_109620 [Yamadazyma tenuis ATCC 10573]WEJ93189.1 sporulation protein rmd1 [Yamadazyma tenuis]